MRIVCFFTALTSFFLIDSDLFPGTFSTSISIILIISSNILPFSWIQLLWFLFAHFMCLFFFFSSMQDLSSLIRGGTHAPCSEAWSPNCWTTREFHNFCFLKLKTTCFLQMFKSHCSHCSSLFSFSLGHGGDFALFLLVLLSACWRCQAWTQLPEPIDILVLEGKDADEEGNEMVW